ncbi:MAG: GTP-binding protein [Candidatus Helarchaeota archaeon]
MGVYKFKLIIIGDPAVGKTSLINRFVEEQFAPEYKETIGTSILRKTITLDDNEISFTLWDIAGQERWTDMRHVYYLGSHGCFCVYDITRPITAQHIENYWYPDLRNFVKKCPIVLIANKDDMSPALKRVDPETGEDIAQRIQAVRFYQTSAKTGSNVEAAFETLALNLINKDLT